MPKPHAHENEIANTELKAYIFTVVAFALLQFVVLAALGLLSSLWIFAPFGLVIFACVIVFGATIFNEILFPKENHRVREPLDRTDLPIERSPELEPRHTPRKSSDPTINNDYTNHESSTPVIQTPKSPLQPTTSRQGGIINNSLSPAPTVTRKILPNTAPPVREELACSSTPEQRVQ